MAQPQMTLAELRTAAQQRADLVGSSFITDDEWASYINSSLFELYDLLIAAYGSDYYVAAPYEITTDGTSERYDLPADFYKLLGVDLVVSTAPNGCISLKPFTFAERNRYAYPNVQAIAGRANLRYRLNADKLWLTPLASAGQTLRLWYVPRLTPLASDSDTADGVSGWLEYVVVDAAIKALQKEESDVSVLLVQKQALTKRIEAMSANRDAGAPATVADVYRTGSDGPDGWGY